MDVLTRETPKPLLPFGGGFTLIDFPLSNLHNSGVHDVWLSVQYLAQAVGDAVGNGKAWDLDRHYGGFKLLVPQEGSGSVVDEGFVEGNAEELLANRDLIRLHSPDVLLVMSADHVYRLDFAEVVDEHLRRGAECTIVTTEVSRAEAINHATVESDASGTVTGFAYKPDEASTGTVATEVFAYSPHPLLEVLEELHRDLAGRPDRDPGGLGDFGDHLVPALIARGKTVRHAMEGYWQDLGRPETYVCAHRDLLAGRLADFSDASWPIRTNRPPRFGAFVAAGAQITDSLVSGGGTVAGAVTRSVLGPGVVVEAGATVRDSIIFAEVTVAAGATVDWAVVDTGTRIGPGAQVGARHPDNSQPDPSIREDRLVLVGRDSVINADVIIDAGARLEPGTVA
jgi:glucose-1-phosphate adenylyltransferase